MALKLGKCRLCLKLGDFYSIFTVDNALQLAEMAMECARIKIFEGDGLPDKVCAECVEKLSSAYIFKQQCERSDTELRRNYVPPPGFSVTPPPNRQSSDSGFSNRTDVSNNVKPTMSTEESIHYSTVRGRKRRRDSEDRVSGNNRHEDSLYKPSTSKSRVEELRNTEKRQRLESDNTSLKESDYDDSISHMSGETDSDEPLINKCEQCDKQFLSKRSLLNHQRMHTRNSKKDNYTLGQDAVVDIPPNESSPFEDEDKQSCEKCGKTFKLKIMLKRHHEVCEMVQLTRKELKVSLETLIVENKIDCKICNGKFKTVEYLEKHMKIVHAAVLKKDSQNTPPVESQKAPVPCVYCHKIYDNYYAHTAHFNTCTYRSNVQTYVCLVCKRKFGNKGTYLNHIKEAHFEVHSPSTPKSMIEHEEKTYECRVCNKIFATQDLLITHLPTHASNTDDAAADSGGEDSRGSTQEDSYSLYSDKSGTTSSKDLKCQYCDKTFIYKKALEKHLFNKHTDGTLELKIESPEKSLNESQRSINQSEIDNPEESDDSSQDDGDNTCDICEKQFSYKKLLLQHKRTKHNMSSGTKRAQIALKDCSVKCLICDITMKVAEVNAHNKEHLAANMKPRNLYTCIECSDTFKSCQALGTHIKLVHRLKRQVTQKFKVTDLADFCEVVVTKTEPLDAIQSHNGFGEVPYSEINDNAKAIVDMSGFTCPICSKKMGTLVSLKRHINWHTNVGKNIESKHECLVCNATFRFNCHYKLHMREHYRDPNLDPKFLTCTICNRKSKHLRAAQMHMKYHSQTRFNTKDYQCAICKRVYQNRKVYLSHMAIHYKRGESLQNTVIGHEPMSKTMAINGVDHQCPHCGKVCDSENSLKCHIIWHKSKSSLYGSRYECEFCQLVFTNKRRHELHVRTHYEDDNGPFKCNICNKGFLDEHYFQRHLKGHNFDNQSHKKRIEKLRINKVKCPICTRYYPDLVKLIRHLRRTHPESKMIKTDPDAPAPQIYPCKLCAKVFQTERRLQHHEESHLRKHQFFKCKFCGKKAISLKTHRLHIKSHLTAKHVDEPLKCTECDETFIKGYDLHYHLRDAHGINETWIAESGHAMPDGPLKDLQCSVCYKILASKGNFERHIDYHNLLRCNYCFHYFSTLRFLEGHLAYICEKKKLIGDTEIYPKKVKCHICYKAFHLQIKLDCHLRTQHGVLVTKEACSKEKEIVCDFCFRVFENEDALTTHKLYHRTVGYFGCIYCNRKFNTETVYRKHKNHHFSQLNVDNPTKCEHCDETFVAFRDMIYHMRDVHGDDKEWIVMPKEPIEEKCDICNKIFFNLPRHLQHHEENRCKKCGEYFFSRLDYDNHLCAIESDEDPENNELDIRPKYEECTFCFKPITKTSSKLKHDLIHKGSGSISCRFCMLKFKTIDAFNIHAFSHRSRKYKKNPLKCLRCPETFIQYGPFMKHLKSVHKLSPKMHYRTTILPERCVVCGDNFPNLHNHYRAHLQHQCLHCKKYFTSNKLFLSHICGVEDADPSKVFTCDENLFNHINSYIPKDEKNNQKYYITKDNNDDRETSLDLQDDESQFSLESKTGLIPISIQSPIISDVLSLYQGQSQENDVERKLKNEYIKQTVDADVERKWKDKKTIESNIVEILDDNSVDVDDVVHPIITIDD